MTEVLDALYARRAILRGDWLAARRFRHLAGRRDSDGARRYRQAQAALRARHGGVLPIVEAVVLRDEECRTRQGLDWLRDGLDALKTEFADTAAGAA